MSSANPEGPGDIAVYAYGSLIWDPGRWIAENTVHKQVVRSPWPIADGGQVDGQLLVLRRSVRLIDARSRLREREGNPPKASIRDTPIGASQHALYCGLDQNIPDECLTAEHLARLAIESVEAAGDQNGIAYLRLCIENGIRTPLTEMYRAAILAITGAPDLEVAEVSVASASRK